MLKLDESSHIVDAEYGVGGKNKVTRITWFSFGTLPLIISSINTSSPKAVLNWSPSCFATAARRLFHCKIHVGGRPSVLYSLVSSHFTARSSYASAVLGIIILSVHPSVHHTRASWRNETTYSWNFDTLWKNNQSSFMTPKKVGGDDPFHLKFALKVTHPFLKNADFDQYLLITSQP